MVRRETFLSQRTIPTVFSVDLQSARCCSIMGPGLFQTPSDELPRFDRAAIAESIQAGRPVELGFYIANESVARKLAWILSELLRRYGRPELEACLYSCVVELVTNAARANMKHAFLKERGVPAHDDERYWRALRDFKAERSLRGWKGRYRRRLEELGLFVLLRFEHDANGLRIEVMNNLPLLPQDERRIREKFSHAMRFRSIQDYFAHYGDETEGEGLGFALNVLFLRAENLDPTLFRIGVVEGRTVARLEAPFSSAYRSARAR